MRRDAKAMSAGSSAPRGPRRRNGLNGMPRVFFTCLVAIAGIGAASASAVAAPCPNAQFRQGPAANLPECRAYEQASPVDKNSQDVFGATSDAVPLGVALDGNSVLFNSIGAFAGHPHGGSALGATNYYFAQRDGLNWKTTPAIPRPTKANTRYLLAASPDLSTSVVFAYAMAFEPDPEPADGDSNYNLFHNRTGETELLVSGNLISEFLAGSSDFGTVAFSATNELVDDPQAPPSPTFKVFASGGGELELVSRKPGTNEPFTDHAVLAGFGATPAKSGLLMNGAASSREVGAVSLDGSRIFFETPVETSGFASIPATAQVYRRSNGTSTELASPSQRGTADPKGPLGKVFQRATPDGNLVFFTSAELLTDDANTGPEREGNDLYRYDIADDELIDISATPGGNGARVVAVVGASADGSRVYYAARGEVVSGQGTADEPKLYLWEEDGTSDGATRYIATLREGGFSETLDEDNWYTSAAKTSRVTADGRFLLFETDTAIPGFDNGGTGQVYRYDAAGNGGAGELLCISCRTDGQPPLGPSQVPTGGARALSQDGHVFFNSGDALLTPDTNERVDVYMWFGGQLHLLSTGTSTGDSRFLGADMEGLRAFFVTRDPLVPQDADLNDDVYVASVGGGLAAQFAAPPPSCAGEQCRTAGPQGPAALSPLTPSFIGAGNARTARKACGKGRRAVKAKKGGTRCVKRHQRSRQRNSSKTGRASR